MQSCGVLDLDIWPGGGDVVSDLTFFFRAMVFCMDLFTWVYSHGYHGFIHMDLFAWIYSHESIVCLCCVLDALL